MSEAAGEALDFIQEKLFRDYVGTCEDNWATAMGNFNAGQASLFYDYIAPAIDGHIEDASQNWPDVEVSDYVQACYGSYDDEDVMLRAFSDTIEAPVGAMEAIIEMAQEAELAADLLDFIEI